MTEVYLQSIWEMEFGKYNNTIARDPIGLHFCLITPNLQMERRLQLTHPVERLVGSDLGH
jgi:hypothetical protein